MVGVLWRARFHYPNENTLYVFNIHRQQTYKIDLGAPLFWRELS